MIADGARRVAPERWAGRSRFEKALTWIAYGIVRVAWGSGLRRRRMVPAPEATRREPAGGRGTVSLLK